MKPYNNTPRYIRKFLSENGEHTIVTKQEPHSLTLSLYLTGFDGADHVPIAIGIYGEGFRSSDPKSFAQKIETIFNDMPDRNVTFSEATWNEVASLMPATVKEGAREFSSR